MVWCGVVWCGVVWMVCCGGCVSYLAVGVLARALAMLEVVQPLPHVLLHTHNITMVTVTVAAVTTMTAAAVVTVTVAAVVEKAT